MTGGNVFRGRREGGITDAVQQFAWILPVWRHMTEIVSRRHVAGFQFGGDTQWLGERQWREPVILTEHVDLAQHLHLGPGRAVRGDLTPGERGGMIAAPKEGHEYQCEQQHDGFEHPPPPFPIARVFTMLHEWRCSATTFRSHSIWNARGMPRELAVTNRFTPLLGPNHAALRNALAFPLEHYGTRFVDVNFWRPFIALICAGLEVQPTDVASGEPGTFPTFIIDRSYVVKLFGEPFDGPRCWQVELEVANAIERRIVGIAVPEVVGAGVLAREPAWRFIVSRFIDGVPFALARESMDQEQRHELVRQLGTMVRAVHERSVPDCDVLRQGWDDWRSFVARQKHGLVERHRAWNILPERLVSRLDDYVAGYVVDEGERPSLVHADLHQVHVLVTASEGGLGQIRGVIDWGDARVGDRYYELPALHLGLFRGDRARLAAFLESYGWDGFRSDAFVRRAMTMTLLHEFNVLDKVSEIVDLGRCATLDDLADRLWRV